MALNEQHVSGFSPGGELYALINEHGILKIWDTETNELKQEYTPNLHLSGPCRCLLWISTCHKSKKDRSKKARKSEEIENVEQLYIVLGTSKGGVALYSYSLGKIDRHLKGEGHEGKINCMTFNGENILLTCGDDKQVLVWDVSEGRRTVSWHVGNEKPCSILYIPQSKNILIGTRQIQVYSLESQELLQTFVGHTSEVTLLIECFYNGVEYALSASKMERIICLWVLNNKNKNQNASCTFLMEDIAHCITCKVENENIKIAAVTRSGVIHIYIVILRGIKVQKPIKPKMTVEIAQDTSSVITPIPAVTASFKFGTMDKEILFGYGDKTYLCFDRISPNYEEKLQILVREDPKKLYFKNMKNKTGSNLKTVTPIVGENKVEYMNAISAVKRKTKAVQVPLETRLHNLNLSNGEIPQTQSKVQLLIQGLHSKNASILWSVLSTNDTKVIELTLQKLPVQYISSLVNELTLLMQKKRSNVQIATNWLKVLVKIHSSQLMAFGSGELYSKFGPCLGIVEYRSNCLRDLSKLNGRLQLLVNQIRRNTEEDALNNENVLVYEDGDSSNSEADDQSDGKSSLDDYWDENVSDVEMNE